MKNSKSVYNADRENSIFAVKLRGLFEETKRTQQELIDFIQIKTGKAPTRQAVSAWTRGNSPDIKTVPIIAEFFKVSTDYLLTETQIRPIDVELTAVCNYTGLSPKSIENIKFISQSGWDTNILLESEHFGALVRKLTNIDEWTSKLNYFNQIILPSLGIDETIYKRIKEKPEAELESIHDILNDEFLKIVKDHIGGEVVGGENIPYRGLEYEEKIDLYEFKLDKDIKAVVEDIKAAHKMDDIFFANYNKFICEALRTHKKKIKKLLQDHKAGTEAQKYENQLEAINAFLSKHGEVPPEKGADENG